MKFGILCRPVVAFTAALALLFTSFAVPAVTMADESDPADQALQEAIATGEQVEVIESTDEYNITYANPDGTYTLTTSREAARVNRGGQWVDIDTNVEAGVDGRLRPVAAALEMDFSSGGDTLLAVAADGDRSLALRVPFTLTVPSVDENIITYPEVMSGVDLVVEVTAEAFSEVLVVKDRQAASNPDLAELELQVETTNLDFQVNPDGSSQAVDSEGDVVLRSSAPVMWDSLAESHDQIPSATYSGENTSPIAVDAEPQMRPFSTSSTTTTTKVMLAPTPEALTGPEVEFPVFIDPAFSASRFVFVVAREGLPSYAQNTDDLRVGYCTWSGCSPHYRARSYINFEVWGLMKKSDGSIPQVVDAKLQLTQTHAASSYASPVRLARTTGAVDGSIVWPGPLGSALQTVNTSSGQTNIQFSGTELTAYVNNLVYHQNGRIGFTLHSANESDAYQWKRFKNNPVLSLTYGFPSSTPVGLTIGNIFSCQATNYVSTGTPTFTARAVNHNIGGGQVRIRFEVHTVPATTVRTYTSAPVASNQNASVTPTAALPAGKYTVRAQSEPVTAESNTKFRSTFTSSQAFTVHTASPGTPTVWSTTHPSNAQFTSPRASAAINVEVGTDTSIVGYFYTWGGGSVPARSNEDCSTNSKPIGSTSGYVKASGGKVTLGVPGYVADGGPATLKVKAMNVTGKVSAERAYSFAVNDAGAVVVPTEAESIVASSSTASRQVVNSARASGGKVLTVTAAAGEVINMTYTPTSDGLWLFQPDLTVPVGRSLTFEIDGQRIDTGYFDDPTWTPHCDPLVYAGSGSQTATAIEPKHCTASSADPIEMNAGQTYVFSIIAPAATTYTVDQVRFVKAD